MSSVTFCPERLAYWYLRLNGYLTIENFVVHPDTGVNQRTDADLLAVRFQHRAELLCPMEDDPQICDQGAFADVILAEVKRSVCSLNGPWTRPDEQNIQRVLRAIGCLDNEQIEEAAAALYNRGRYQSDLVAVRLVAFGDQKGNLIPEVRQILFNDMITFLWKRLKHYYRQKASVGNWPQDGQELRAAFDRCGRKLPVFRTEVRRVFGLRNDTSTS